MKERDIHRVQNDNDGSVSVSAILLLVDSQDQKGGLYFCLLIYKNRESIVNLSNRVDQLIEVSVFRLELSENEYILSLRSD